MAKALSGRHARWHWLPSTTAVLATSVDDEVRAQCLTQSSLPTHTCGLLGRSHQTPPHHKRIPLLSLPLLLLLVLMSLLLLSLLVLLSLSLLFSRSLLSLPLLLLLMLLLLLLLLFSLSLLLMLLLLLLRCR